MPKRWTCKRVVSTLEITYNAGTDDYYGGNVHLFYKNCPGGEISYLHINSSRFLYGKNQHESGFSGGLSLAVHCINIKIIITDSFLRGNTAYNDGGNLALSFINTTHLFPSNALILSNSYIKDGGMFIKILQAFSKKTTHATSITFFIFQTPTLLETQL